MLGKNNEANCLFALVDGNETMNAMFKLQVNSQLGIIPLRGSLGDYHGVIRASGLGRSKRGIPLKRSILTSSFR